MFEQALRMKLRFSTSLGAISVEDLWDLPLTNGKVNLDGIAIGLHKQLRETSEMTSFVTPPNTDIDDGRLRLQLGFDIVKHIIDVKVKERDEQKTLRDRATKKQQLLEIMARKENSELEGKSLDELRAMIDTL